MYFTELPKPITHMVQLFYALGLWDKGDKTSQKLFKVFYSIYSFLFPIALIFGAIQSDKTDESVNLTEVAVVTGVIAVKMAYMIWKQEDIFVFFNEICVHSTEDLEEFESVNKKINRFSNIMEIFYIGGVSCTAFMLIVIPFIGSEKRLLFSIGFPLDYENSEIAFWIAFLFTLTDVLLLDIGVLFSILIWYLLLNCSVMYEIFEKKLRVISSDRMVDGKNRKTENANLRDALIVEMKLHQKIFELTHQVQTYLAHLLALQIIASGAEICGSVYVIAFSVGTSGNIIEYSLYFYLLMYNILDVFFITYFGNEIKLSSSRLLYCLFESDWIDKPQSYKKCLIIFGERLKRPHEINVFNVYPLNLDSFTKILKSAYTLFNILENLK